MAYVPPHKRHPKSGDSTSSPLASAPPPQSVIPYFQRNLNKNAKYGVCEAKWFVVGLDEPRVSTLTRLEPVAWKYFQRKSGEKPLVLVLNENCTEDATEFTVNPWISMYATLKKDLLLSFEQVKGVLMGDMFGETKAQLILRFGKVHFHGTRFRLGSITGVSPSRDTLQLLHRSLYTNIPPSYTEYITSDVVPKLNFEFLKENEFYSIKIWDNTQTESFIMCKCVLGKETNHLEFFKIASNSVRRLVADMSCLDKSLDLRLILLTLKNPVAFMTDDDLESIKRLINLAIPDSEIKGGLRWPSGKQSVDKYTVVAVCHTISKTFRNSSMKLKVRYADRFDFRSSDGEIANEISLRMPGVIAQLVNQMADTELALEMLKENLEFIYKHFLHSSSFT